MARNAIQVGYSSSELVLKEWSRDQKGGDRSPFTILTVGSPAVFHTCNFIYIILVTMV